MFRSTERAGRVRSTTSRLPGQPANCYHSLRLGAERGYSLKMTEMGPGRDSGIRRADKGDQCDGSHWPW